MRVYLAAPYGARDQIREAAGHALALDYSQSLSITSTWLAETHEITAGTEGAAVALTDEQVAEHARTDLADIDRSDALVLFTSSWCGIEGGGGRHVETGYALAKGLPVYVVGDPENVFHRLGLPFVTLVRSLPDAIAHIDARLARPAVHQKPRLDRAWGA